VRDGDLQTHDLDYLRAHLGPTLTRAICDDLEDRRAECAAHVFGLLASHEGGEVARLWFIGSNPWLDGESPVTALREWDLWGVEDAAWNMVNDVHDV
jgi:hypothetical protein